MRLLIRWQRRTPNPGRQRHRSLSAHAPEAAATPPQKGDLNGDNRLTPADAAIALRLAASGGWDANADVNHDSRITSLDALMILRAAAGAIAL